jgi:hypothetical protein
MILVPCDPIALSSTIGIDKGDNLPLESLVPYITGEGRGWFINARVISR